MMEGRHYKIHATVKTEELQKKRHTNSLPTMFRSRLDISLLWTYWTNAASNAELQPLLQYH